MKNRRIGYEHIKGENNCNLAIVFIHAYPVNKNMWQTQKIISENGLDVYTYDMFGFGESETSDDKSDFSIELSVNDLENFINNIVKKPVVLCGLSLGAYIVLNLGFRKNDLVKGLIINSVGAGSDNKDDFYQEVKSWAKTYKNKGVDYFIDEIMLDELFGYIEKNSPEDHKKIDVMIRENSESGVINTASEIIAPRLSIYDYEEKIKNINVPILIMVGTLDKDCIKPSQFINMHAKNSKYIEFENLGHFINMEASERFNSNIIEFISENKILSQ